MTNVSKPFSPAELVTRVVAHHQLSRLRESALVEARSTVGNLRTALASNRTIQTAVHGAAANITLLSYAGQWCSIGIAVDDVAVADPTLLVAALADGFAELGVEPAPGPHDPYDPLPHS